MTKTKRLTPTLVLWTLIPLMFLLVAGAAADLLHLGTMVARAEKQALEGHFRKLSALVVGDSAPATGPAADGLRLVAFRPGGDVAARPRLGLTVMTPSPQFGRFSTAGDFHALVLRDVASDLVPASADPLGLRGRSMLDDFKRKTGAEAALFRVGDGKITPFAATMPAAAWLSEDEVRKAAVGETVLREHRLADRPVALLAGPVHDAAGRRVAVAVIAHDRAAFTASVGIVRKVLLGIGLLLLFVLASVACAISAEPPSAEPLRS